MNTILLAKMAQISSSIYLAARYGWPISNASFDKVNKQGLTSIKKYWRYTCLVKIELDWLHNCILALVIFVKYLYRGYKN